MGIFDVIYTSPLSRCIQTTNEIVEEMQYNKNIIIDESLIEIRTGMKSLPICVNKKLNYLLKYFVYIYHII